MVLSREVAMCGSGGGVFLAMFLFGLGTWVCILACWPKLREGFSFGVFPNLTTLLVRSLTV